MNTKKVDSSQNRVGIPKPISRYKHGIIHSEGAKQTAPDTHTHDMADQGWTPRQRAFSPEEVSTMLGVSRAIVLSLLEKEKLGSKKIHGSHRIFLSDLESYLGEDRARSLVRDLSGDEPKWRGEKRAPKFEKVAETYGKISKDKAIVLAGLSESDLQSIRDLLHYRFGKKNVLIRSAKQEDGTLKAVVQSRESSSRSQIVAKMEVT